MGEMIWGHIGRDRARVREIEGGCARLGEIRVRLGEIWGDMGRYGAILREIVRDWGRGVSYIIRGEVCELLMSYNIRL